MLRIGLQGVATGVLVCTANSAVAATENFNTLSAGANNTTSTSLPVGWKFLEAGGDTSYRISNGGLNTGDTYSYGGLNAADRALGTLASNSVASTIGATYVYGGNVASISISYTGEQWRNGDTASAADRLFFYHSTETTSLTLSSVTTATAGVAPATPTGYTRAAALDLISLVSTPATASNTNQTTPLGTIPVSATLTGTNVVGGAGTLFTLEWIDTNISGSDDGLAIDDFTIRAFDASGAEVSISAAPEPTTAVLGLLGSSVILTRRRQRPVSRTMS